MQKCKYEDKFINAFAVWDEENDIINEDMELEWKRAGKRGLLTCVECGHLVSFKVKDPHKKRPHFFHKVMKGAIRECNYNEESEEHIRGIGIILDYMKEAYKNIKYEFRYKLSNNKYADLYFEFDDGNKLAIEFERQDLDFEYWEEKHNSLKSLNINDLWFIKMDNSEDINKLYDLSFYKRVVLNNTKELLLLNIENRTVTMARKMEYRDEFNMIIDNNVFKHTYKLSDTKVLSSGEFVTTPNFNKMFNDANLAFKDNCHMEYKIKKEEEKQRELNNIQKTYVSDPRGGVRNLKEALVEYDG